MTAVIATCKLESKELKLEYWYPVCMADDITKRALYKCEQAEKVILHYLKYHTSVAVFFLDQWKIIAKLCEMKINIFTSHYFSLVIVLFR